MNNIYRFPPHDQRYDEAGIWIAKLDNELSATEHENLQEWLAADQRNQTVLLKMAELWDDMSILSRLSDLFPKPRISSFRLRAFRLATAAVIVIGVLAGVWTAFNLKISTGSDPVQTSNESVPDVVYATAVGEQSTVHLQDGSRVVLNTDSLIRVNYSDAYRSLILERGEIHVQVTKDKDRPFTVIAGDKIVKAVGTSFSLEITSDQRIELIVTEGKVMVGVQQNPQSMIAHVAPDVQEASSVTVAAGEQMILDVDEEEITEVSPEEIDIKLSWRQGNLVFRGESLEDAVAEIGRYTTVEFVILDEDLKKVRIAGMFKAGDVDGLLSTLRENFDVSNERTSDGKILLTGL